MDLNEACGDDPQLLCETVFEWTSSEVAARLVDWFVDRPLRIALIAVVAWIVTRLARRTISAFATRLVRDPEQNTEEDSDTPNLFERSVDRLTYIRNRHQRARQRALTLEAVLKSIASTVIWIVAGLLILGELGINLAPLIAGAGIAGIAIGFGAQSVVRDFLAGVFIIVEDQYGVGDIVDAGEAIGTVEEVTLRTTRLRDLSGVLWTIPNGEIRRVGNMSQLWSRSVLDIEVAYDTDIEMATRVIKEVLDDVWRQRPGDATIIEEPQVLGIESFGADAITIRAVVKTEPAEQFTVARVVRGELKKAFDRAQIEFPFPQRTVWLRSES